MGIATQNDRYKYLEDRIQENGGLDHLEESEEWIKLEGMTEDYNFNIPHFDMYIHRTRFFKATVYYDSESDGESVEYTDEVVNIRVVFCRPKHHYDEEEDLPPIHKAYEE